MDFSKFDEAIDLNDLNKKVEEEKNNSFEVPEGTYIVDVKKMELGATKKDGSPMFTMDLVIKEGDMKKRHIFFNRKIYGTKNDASMIQSVLTILEKFQTETAPEFKGYSAFADNIMDIYEEVQGKVEIEIDYVPDTFNSVSIKEVYDL